MRPRAPWAPETARRVCRALVCRHRVISLLTTCPRHSATALHGNCQGFAQTPASWCTHRLAHALCKRATTLAQQTTVPAPVAPRPAPTIPAEFVTTIHGRAFVQYVGLLAMAHAQGLSSLQAELVTVPPELATARATAIFADGRTFSEAADATPDNVSAQVRKHFARCALTRAKSRALRDALNMGMVALEELD